MPADRPQFNADLEGLLREVAADPRAKLLRIPNVKALHASFQDRADVGEHATGLTNAERQLVRVYRAELAMLLRQACTMQIFAHKNAPSVYIRQVTTTQRHEVLEPDAWRARVRDELSLASSTVDTLQGIDLLRECVRERGALRVSATQLAAASMCLEPSDQARIYPGNELLLNGDPQTALRVFLGVIERGASRRNIASAWCNIAKARSDMADERGALEAYRKAAEAMPTFVAPSLSWFIFAVVHGSAEDVGRAAAQVETTLDLRHPALREFVAMWRSDTEAWAALRARSDRLRAAELGLGPVALEVIHAFR
jgi:hypothetical protein